MRKKASGATPGRKPGQRAKGKMSRFPTRSFGSILRQLYPQSPRLGEVLRLVDSAEKPPKGVVPGIVKELFLTGSDCIDV